MYCNVINIFVAFEKRIEREKNTLYLRMFIVLEVIISKQIVDFLCYWSAKWRKEKQQYNLQASQVSYEIFTKFPIKIKIIFAYRFVVRKINTGILIYMYKLKVPVSLIKLLEKTYKNSWPSSRDGTILLLQSI